MLEKMSPAECNYGIGNKELLAIVIDLEKWHIYLHQLPHMFTIIIDHYNLQTFSTKALLCHRQACWARELAQYDFKIMFRPGTQNGKTDALTRQSGDLPKEGHGRGRPTQPLIPTEKFSNLQLSALLVKHDQDIREALTIDTLAQKVFQCLKDGTKRHPVVPLGECTISDNLLLINKLFYITNKLELYLGILKSCYNHPAAGHPSRAATYELVSRN